MLWSAVLIKRVLYVQFFHTKRGELSSLAEQVWQGLCAWQVGKSPSTCSWVLCGVHAGSCCASCLCLEVLLCLQSHPPRVEDRWGGFCERYVLARHACNERSKCRVTTSTSPCFARARRVAPPTLGAVKRQSCKAGYRQHAVAVPISACLLF